MGSRLIPISILTRIPIPMSASPEEISRNLRPGPFGTPTHRVLYRHHAHCFLTFLFPVRACFAEAPGLPKTGRGASITQAQSISQTCRSSSPLHPTRKKRSGLTRKNPISRVRESADFAGCPLKSLRYLTMNCRASCAWCTARTRGAVSASLFASSRCIPSKNACIELFTVKTKDARILLSPKTWPTIFSCARFERLRAPCACGAAVSQARRIGFSSTLLSAPWCWAINEGRARRGKIQMCRRGGGGAQSQRHAREVAAWLSLAKTMALSTPKDGSAREGLSSWPGG